MRGPDTFTEGLFTMRRLDDFVPANHPLRRIRAMANEALAKMDGLFSAMYEADIKGGRPSIAPEKLMRAMLLQILFSVRSERQLMEQTQYNMLFRWFIGLSMMVTFAWAGLVGILAPLTLKRFGADPAVASSVFVLTTIDMASFFVFLGLASVMLL